MTDIKRVGVLGSGLMGSGIAQVAAAAGYDTTVRDVSQQVWDKARAGIEKSLAKFVEKGKLAAADRDATLKRLRFTTTTADLKTCDIVVEAVTEDLELKNALWKELDGLCGPATIFSSNTSSLTIAAMVRLDVFELKMVAGPHRPSSSFQRAFLSSRSSVTASTTMSHVFRSAVVVVKRRRLRVASRSAAASFPFSTNLASDFSIPARALSQTCWDTSRTVVSYPAAAAT